MTPPLRSLPPPSEVVLPESDEASELIVDGRTHSPHWQPDRASPLAPKSVRSVCCLKAHSVPVAASHMIESVAERSLIVVVRSSGAPGAPQNSVPGMQVQRRFWHVQSTCSVCAAEPVELDWTHESAAQKNCSTIVVLPLEGAYQSCAVRVPPGPSAFVNACDGSTVFWMVRVVAPLKTDCRVGLTTWQDAKPSVQDHALRLHTGSPRPSVREIPLELEEDDVAPLRSARADEQAMSLEQTLQFGPSKPSEHWRAHPALALPDSTVEKSWRSRVGTSGLSQVATVQSDEDEKPGGHWHVPLLRAVP